MNPNLRSSFCLLIGLFLILHLPLLNGQQAPSLVKNINTPSPTEISARKQIAAVNGKIIFVGDGNNLGSELWQTDGTLAGTKILKDIQPGISSSNPSQFFEYNNKLLFTATNDTYATELWVSDGTEAGTQILKDITPGSSFSYITSIFEQNGLVYFLAGVGPFNTAERWVTDGTPAGTQKSLGIIPDRGSERLDYAFLNGKYYYGHSNDFTYSIELYSWDGVSPTEELVKDIFPGSTSSYPTNFVTFNGKVYFRAQDTYNNMELWTTDGTEAGTFIVEDQININGYGSNPYNFIIAGDHLYFLARSDDHGLELFRLNDTGDGVQLVKDFTTGTSDSYFYGMTAVGNKLVLGVKDNSSLEEAVWSTEGEAANTTIILDLSAENHEGSTSIMFDFNGLTYFSVGESNFSGTGAIYKTDGTAAGTQLVDNDITTFSTGAAALNGFSYFSGINDNNGAQLRRTDGNSVELVKHLPSEESSNSNPSDWVDLGSFKLFKALTHANGIELWRTDGTEGGTQLVKDIQAGSRSAFRPFNATSKFSEEAAAFQGKLFFMADDGNDISLWYSDGTAAGTQAYFYLRQSTGPASGSSNISNLEVYNNELYFGLGGDPQSEGLYKITDPGQAPVLVAPDLRPYELTMADQKLYFLHRDTVSGGGGNYDYNIQLYESDGSTAGTVFVETLGLDHYTTGSNVDLQNVNGKLTILKEIGFNYSFDYDGEHIFDNVDAFNQSQSPTFFQDAIFFGNNWDSNNPGNTGALYKWQNSTLSNIKSFPAFKPGPNNLMKVGNKLLFTAHADDATGNELWVSDGTTNGTVLLKDIAPGSTSSNPENLLQHNDKLYFSATDGTGMFIYESDGSSTGTRKIAAFPNGLDVGYSNFFAAGNLLYFSADEEQIGRELWTIDLSITPPPTGPDLALSLSISNPTPGIYANTLITATLSNTGTENMSGIEVNMPVTPGILAFTDATQSQGNFSSYFEKWTVGNLAAGQSATLALNLFTLTSDPVNYFAQVSSANEVDIDSSPGNGTCCVANEDDEGFLTINGSTVQEPDLRLANLISDPSGMPGDITNYTVDLINSGTAVANGAYSIGVYLSTDNIWSSNDIEVGIINTGNTPIGTIAAVPGAITLPQGQTPGNYFLVLKVDKDEVISESNENNNTIATPYTVLSGNGNCSIGFIYSLERSCFDGNTPTDPSDDTFDFYLIIGGSNTSASYTLDLSDNSGSESYTYAYDDTIRFSRLIANGPIQFLFTDSDEPACNISHIVSPSASCSNGGNGVDLNLNISASIIDPALYTSTTFTLTLTNEGTETATGVIVDFPVPTGYAFVDQTVNNGIYSNWLGTWNIGDVAAGQTATMDLTLFALTTAATQFYAQVSQQNETDNDSSPGNGTPPIVNEDDETAVQINGSFPFCSFSDFGIVTTCMDNGTSDPSDDLFTFTLDITGTGLGNTYDLISAGFSWSDVPYTSPGLAGFFPISGGDILLSIMDESGACSADFTVFAPAPCSGTGGCGLSAEVITSSIICTNGPLDYTLDEDLIYLEVVVNSPDPNMTWTTATSGGLAITGTPGDIITFGFTSQGGYAPGQSVSYFISDVADPSCNTTVTFVPDDLCDPQDGCDFTDFGLDVNCFDNGNNDPTDDYFNFTLNPTAIDNTAPDYTVSINGLPGSLSVTLPYGQSYTSADFDLSYGPVYVQIEDGNLGCYENLTVDPPQNCGGGNGDIDLALDLFTNTPNPEVYTTFAFEVQVNNFSANEATNVSVDFPIPPGMVMSGGNEYSATQGSYPLYGGQTWTVGDLPPGGSANIVFNLFLLDNSPIVAYGQVSAADQNDIDSTPGNGTCCVANEDDESTFSITPALAPTPRLDPATASKHLVLQKVFPNPATNQVKVLINAPKEQFSSLLVYNSLGQIMFQQAIDLQSGTNTIELATASLPTGMYYVHLPEAHQKYHQLRFVKIED